VARQRSPNRDKAFELYKNNNGEIDFILMVLTRLQACQDSTYKAEKTLWL